MRTSQNKNSDRHSSKSNLWKFRKMARVLLQDSKSKTHPKNGFTAAVCCQSLQMSCEKMWKYCRNSRCCAQVYHRVQTKAHKVIVHMSLCWAGIQSVSAADGRGCIVKVSQDGSRTLSVGIDSVISVHVWIHYPTVLLELITFLTYIMCLVACMQICLLICVM